MDGFGGGGFSTSSWKAERQAPGNVAGFLESAASALCHGTGLYTGWQVSYNVAGCF